VRAGRQPAVDAASMICDRCGDVRIDNAACRCRTPYDQAEVRHRHRAAVGRARAGATDRRRRGSSSAG
jgi:hypothetical protein